MTTTPLHHVRELRRRYDLLVKRAQKHGEYLDPPDELLACRSLPSVDRWKFITLEGEDTPRLHGWARYHPTLGPSDWWFTSTPLKRIDPDHRWAWSTNHLFRLLKPASTVQARLKQRKSSDAP